MGHKKAGTTSIYTHLFADAYEGVEEALAAVLDVNGTSMDCGVTTEQSGSLDQAESPRDGSTARPIAA